MFELLDEFESGCRCSFSFCCPRSNSSLLSFSSGVSEGGSSTFDAEFLFGYCGSLISFGSERPGTLFRSIVCWYVSASSFSCLSEVWGGSDGNGIGGGGGGNCWVLRGSIVGDGCGRGVSACCLWEGVVAVGDGGVLGIVGGVKEGRGEGGREKNPGGGIPGGRAGKLIAVGAGGKGGVGLRGRGTGAIDNGDLIFDRTEGILCGSRPTSAEVSSTNPTEPGRFFDELPP